VDAHGLPLRVIVTEGSQNDIKQADTLIHDLNADFLLADKAYDSDAFVQKASTQGIKVNIPNKINRKTPRPFDQNLYKVRHLVENTFLALKRWRSIATRYAKHSKSFLAIIQIKCIEIWGKL
jgi:transposase